MMDITFNSYVYAQLGFASQPFTTNSFTILHMTAILVSTAFMCGVVMLLL